MEEEAWESWFQDLEIAGDLSFAFGAQNQLGSASQENFENCWDYDTNTTILNAENGIIFTSNIPCSTSDSVCMLQDKATNTNNLNAENGIIFTSNNPSSSSDSVYVRQDKASFEDHSNGFFQSQTNVKERDRPDGRNTRVHDHLLAERMRRGKISQHFIALSALIPGLKRADKASVLEGAIKQLKQLEEQVKTLEQHTKNKKTTGESVVFVKKDNYPMTSSMDTTSFDKSRWNRTVAKADVEARVSDKKVLIRVQCEKQEGIMVKTIKEIENLHLSVTNSIVMPFGRSILDITIIAEMEDEFNLNGKELARNLRVALLRSINA